MIRWLPKENRTEFRYIDFSKKPPDVSKPNPPYAWTAIPLAIDTTGMITRNGSDFMAAESEREATKIF